MQDILNEFRFSAHKSGLIGVEREFFLLNSSNQYVPESFSVLRELSNWRSNFQFELSACQIESKTDPVRFEFLSEELERIHSILLTAIRDVNLKLSYDDFANENLPHIIYNHPLGKYKIYEKVFTKEELHFAMRAAGTHIHFGMPDLETAIICYNELVKNTRGIMLLDDRGSMRLKHLSKLANIYPTFVYSLEEYLHQDHMAKLLKLIKISVHGTVEVRVFGTTNDVSEIIKWANFCRNIIQPILNERS